jgi:hypothetical protein
MRTLFTRFALLAAFGFGALRPAAAQQTVYVPAAVTGYTADVIADGSGPVANSTTNTVDRGIPTVRWCFANSTFPGLNATNSLPASGLIQSASTPFLTYQMAPANGNNSLRIDGAGSGTLTLVNPQSCSEVMMLATEGNGTTAPEKTFIVTFTDNTTQTFTNIIVPDWFGGTITPAYFVNSRVSYVTNAIDQPGGNNPRLYEVRLSLNVANYNKAVRSVTVSKASTDPVLNIMGVSLGSNCLSAPNAGVATANLFPALVCPNTPVTLALSGNDNSASITYQWQRSTDNGVTWTDIAGATTNPYTIRPTVTAQYRARVICRVLSSNSTPVTVTVLPTVATVSYSATVPAVFCQSGTAPVVTATPAGGTFSSTTGLVINSTTGTINLASSATGTYTVTYSLPNACQAVGTTTVSIIRPVATLAYSAASFCRISTTAPAFSPAGGAFSAPTGLVINASTGVIDLAASTAGTYAVTYTSTGQCPATATAPVTILPTPTPAISYGSPTPFCAASPAGFPTATPAGGTFSAPAGLTLNTQSGIITPATSTPGTYTVTYAIAAPCPATATTTVTIAAPAPTFSYTCPPFYKNGPSTTPVLAGGATGGTFSAPAGLSINPTTGVVNLTASTVGSYAITYTTAAGCTSSSPFEVVDALVFPNVITPNGDGKNESLLPNLPNVTGYHMQVYSRWGRKVFDGTNPAQGWTAADNGPGMYYYQVEYTDCTGARQSIRNWVEVVK